jgi:hypothetical protein
MIKRIKRIITPFLVLGSILFVFTFVVAPALTASNTIVNIFGAILGFIEGLATYIYLDTLLKPIPKEEAPKEFGETELDYIPKPKTKRKYTKKIKKDGFPLPPHNPKKPKQ